MSKSWGKLGDSFDQDLNTTDNVQFAQIITAILKAASASGLEIQDDDGNTVIEITDAGNVGVGGTPSNKLFVKDTIGNPLILDTTVSNCYATVKVNGSNVGFVGYGTGVFGSGNAYFGLRGQSGLYLAGGASGVFILIEAGGQMGVNTKTPEQELDVKGNIGLRKNDSIGTDTQAVVNVPGFENDVAASLLGNLITQINSHDGLKNVLKQYLDSDLISRVAIYRDSEWKDIALYEEVTIENILHSQDFQVQERPNDASSITADGTNFVCDRWAVDTDDDGGTYGGVGVSPDLISPGFLSSDGVNALPKYVLDIGGYFGGTPGNNSEYRVRQRIPNVRKVDEVTITVSFFGWVSTGTQSVGVAVEQNFGSGGSASVYQSDKVTITTTRQEFTVTLTMPSLSGKTIGTEDYFEVMLHKHCGSTLASTIGYSGAITSGNNDIYIDSIRVNHGDQAVSFYPKDLQTDKDICKWFYEKLDNSADVRAHFAHGYVTNATVADALLEFAEKRAVPTISISAASTFYVISGTGTGQNPSNITVDKVTKRTADFNLTVSGHTAGMALSFRGDAGTSLGDAFIEIDAEV